jgi:hypothetical protein
MIRGGSEGLRAHFTRATISAPPAAAFGTGQPGTPIERRGCRAISLGHLAGIGLDLVLTVLAPDDQPNFAPTAAPPSVIGGPG